MIQTTRVIGKAEVHHIGTPGSQIAGRRNESVLLGSFEVDQSAVAAVHRMSGPAGHYVGVYIDRIDRVGNRDSDIRSQEFLEIAGVAFGSVGNEDVIGRYGAAPGRKIPLRNGAPEEFITLFGPVASETLSAALFLDTLMEGPDDGRRKGASDVADPEFDNAAIGMGRRMIGDAATDFDEEVARLEFSEMGVQTDHGRILTNSPH
jgi:hypothetical protein